LQVPVSTERALTRKLTSTSYAILGFLAVRSSSVYGLATQMRRNVHYFWPRAESNLYAEPKRLVEDGLVTSQVDYVGKRGRTTYTITRKGRRALARWLAEPVAETRIESDILVRVLFAPYGTKEDLLRSLDAYQQQVRDKQEFLLTIFEQYLRGEDPFPDRVHVNVVLYRLVWEYAQTEARWATWALETVDGWPDVVGPHGRAELLRVLEESIAPAC
jgi:DNA-binding PadR family transcriptional regulator